MLLCGESGSRIEGRAKGNRHAQILLTQSACRLQLLQARILRIRKSNSGMPARFHRKHVLVIEKFARLIEKFINPYNLFKIYINIY